MPPQWARELPIGWSAKLVNVFLKTTSYVGDLGREGLRDVLHPPLDTGLRKGLREYFRNRPDMLKTVVAFRTISGIRCYAEYRTAIKGCCAAAKVLGCSALIEVEQLAGLGLRDGESPPGALVELICRGDS